MSSHSSHMSSVQWPHVADGYHTGWYRCETCPLSHSLSGQLCSKGYSAHVSPLPAVPSPLPEATLLPVSFVSLRDFLYASTVCGMQPLLLKQMRKDPKHYFAPCFLHLVKLGDHNISVQIVLHSSEQPHSNPLSPCLPQPPSLITTLLWAPLCGPAPHLQTLSSHSSLHILRLLSACCPKLLA